MTAQSKKLSAKTLIVGMGVTGLACAKFLVKQGIPFCALDSRLQPPMLADFAALQPKPEIYLGSFDKAALQGIETLILSPGVAVKQPFIQLAYEQGIHVVGDIQLFADHANAPLIAITGSNGKSTVTTLLGELMQAAGYQVALGGNLGVAAIELLRDPAPDAYVLELSSFQLELVEQLRLTAAAVLNISEDHMDRYIGIAEYAASKARIFDAAQCCVFNKDDELVASMAMGTRLAFTSKRPQAGEFGLLNIEGDLYLAYGDQPLLAVDALRLQGEHNYVNILAALALLSVFVQSQNEKPVRPESLFTPALIACLKSFAGLPHRSQWLAESDGVNWINDSKATNIASAQAAIDAVQGQVVLIAGGDGKGADFTQLQDVVERKVKALILLGQDASLLESALHELAPCWHAADMPEAVNLARQQAVAGDTVLLAPACASIDMFKNYQARGDAFARCVQEVTAA